MILYACILFAVSVLCAVFAVLLMRGRADLMQECHREYVTKRKAYAKSCSFIMWILSVALLLGGLIPFLIAGKTGLLISVILLTVGFIGATATLVIVQKKYNRKIK